MEVLKQKKRIALDKSLEIRDRMIHNSNWEGILSVFLDSTEIEDYFREKLSVKDLKS